MNLRINKRVHWTQIDTRSEPSWVADGMAIKFGSYLIDVRVMLTKNIKLFYVYLHFQVTFEND